MHGVWECPELFEAPVEGGLNGESRWVLKVDVNAGAPFGGSGGQYFVGSFDGKEFRPDAETKKTPLWIDFGKDFYASQCWNDAPSGGRPVWIAWMNNWQYANDIPTSPWRGQHDGAPVCGTSRSKQPKAVASFRSRSRLERLRGESHRIENRAIAEGETKLEVDGIEGTSLEIVAEFAAREADAFGLKVRRGENEETLVGIDVRAGTVFIDRSSSGATNFSRDFPGRHSCRLTSTDRPIRLHVLVDATSVEVFADDGQAVLTDQIFPGPPQAAASACLRSEVRRGCDSSRRGSFGRKFQARLQSAAGLKRPTGIPSTSRITAISSPSGSCCRGKIKVPPSLDALAT